MTLNERSKIKSNILYGLLGFDFLYMLFIDHKPVGGIITELQGLLTENMQIFKV